MYFRDMLRLLYKRQICELDETSYHLGTWRLLQMYLVNPQSPYYDVVDGSDTLAPGVVTLGLVEHHMTSAQWKNGEIFASKL